MKNQLNFRNGILSGLLTVLFFASGLAQDKPEKMLQESNEYIAEAQEAQAEDNFALAEAAYRKAISKDPSNTTAKYNMGNLYYGKEKSQNAEARLKQAAKVAATKEEKHRIYHNLGNSYMQQKNYQEAVNAFKDALRNDPSDDETRYNLALAKKMLEKEKQNQDQDDQENKGGGEDEQEKKDQEQKDQNDDGKGGDDKDQNQKPKDEGENKKDKKEGDQNEDKEKEEGEQKKQNEGKGDKEKQQQQMPAQGQLSPQQIKSLLEAMNNEEKKVQDKINAEKAKGVKVRSEKDW
ncbi:tetratricopeptide repeat protein [Christiangramia salexigens]|uniref:Uncharacterized protein n=1 Tax=Christiangramia salexigens TaxID=1913577 RepID=A0A1L3J8K4_9FLAO|nr:tetratricopeptide repeat protein [Christiangramia salexigens]APG61455.1 hypothetical protein LPB144_09970 [Christiangramia salexigens]